MFGPASTQPPRLIDFAVLRLPLVEVVFVGLLVNLFFEDMQGTEAASGFMQRSQLEQHVFVDADRVALCVLRFSCISVFHHRCTSLGFRRTECR